MEITQEGIITRLADGAPVYGEPHDTDAYRATAADLGYPTDPAGLLRMCREHELTHSLLAGMLGLPESPTLRAVIEGRADGDLYRLEETAVLAIQRFMQAINIIK